MFAKYDQLKALQKFGEAQLKLELLTKVSQVNSIYYDLVQQQQQVAALDTTLTISTQRLQLAQNRFSIGKASKLEVLNAQVDLNTDKVNISQKLLQYQNTKVALNQLLARKTANDFKVSSEIIVDKKLVLNELSELAEKQNPQLTAQVINKQIAELQLKQVKADRYPSVRVTTGYQFSDTQSSLGFVTQSATRGLNYGFGASLNIFDGFAQNRNEKTAKIEIENATIALEQQQLNLHSQLTVAYQTYLTYLDLMELEATNEAIAKQNLSITIAKFRIGTITTLEFRTAQLNEINAKVRYTAAQFQAKLAEIKLKELAGKLDL
jgi:outer membrane protein TolC